MGNKSSERKEMMSLLYETFGEKYSKKKHRPPEHFKGRDKDWRKVKKAFLRSYFYEALSDFVYAFYNGYSVTEERILTSDPWKADDINGIFDNDDVWFEKYFSNMLEVSTTIRKHPEIDVWKYVDRDAFLDKMLYGYGGGDYGWLYCKTLKTRVYFDN